jgi:hypothetical protein
MNQADTAAATTATDERRPRRVYLPIAGVIAACLGGVVLFNPGQGGLLASAQAQPAAGQPETTMWSAAEQRKEMIAQLRAMNARLERVESMMSKGLSVKVTEMPAIRIPREEK